MRDEVGPGYPAIAAAVLFYVSLLAGCGTAGSSAPTPEVRPDPPDATVHGSWVPHIMVFVPYLTRAEAGGRGVFRPGRWDAAFFAIIPGFIDPEFEEQQSADGQ